MTSSGAPPQGDAGWADQLRTSTVGRLPDPGRFALGTFTRLPVPPPRRLDVATAGRGLMWAPVVGAGLGVVSGFPLMVTGVDVMARLLSAALVVALAAWLTRALHWDGLADLADGLGSGAPPERAQQIMTRSDIGPFGVLTLVLVLLLQVLSLAQLPADGPAWAAWVLAMTLGRLAVVAACGPWARPARPNGLGALVAGAVGLAGVALALAQALAIGALSAVWGPLPAAYALLWAPLAALGVAAVLGVVARRRLGGITGDVLGATVELATLAALLTFALR